MFAAMFKSLFNDSESKKNKLEPETIDKSRKNVEDILTNLCEANETSNNIESSSTSKYNAIEAIIQSSNVEDIYPEYLNDSDSVDNFDDSKSEISNNEGPSDPKQKDAQAVNSDKRIMNQINSLQCPFTWNLKANNKKKIIPRIQNKYGEYNLDISHPEFTLQRFIGNLIIGYELFHTGKQDLAQIKISEIGKWLEELDKSTDDFYLSISSGVLHILKGTFIHMLYATNMITECKMFIEDIESFASMDGKPRATVHAIRAAVLSEYGGNTSYHKKACECAKKACDLDPNTSHWFYIYSLALTGQRQLLQSFKSCPSPNEISAILQAVILSEEKNVLFKYYEMELKKDTILWNFHNNKNKTDKSVFQKNIEDNKSIVKTIKTIIGMEPKDPHIIIKCARILITLPYMVRDLNLGRVYLTKALKMAPNDVSVFSAIEKVTEVYKKMSSKKVKHTTETSINQPPLRNIKLKLGEEFNLIVLKHKNGEDPIPHLTKLLEKYDEYDKLIIFAYICSYTVLFTNNLRTGVEQFVTLIERPEIKDYKFITDHYTKFISKQFNLAELICSEIRLATNSSGPSNADLIFYFKMLTTIVEKFKLDFKDIDLSMKKKLIDNPTDQFKFMNKIVQSESDSSDTDDDTDVKTKKPKTKNHMPKHLQKTGPKVFEPKVDVSKKPKKKINTPKTKVQTKTHQTNANNMDQLKSKMTNLLNSAEKNKSSNNSKLLTEENIRNLQTQVELENYTQQLYKNIICNTQQQYNLPNITTYGLNRFFNQNHGNLNSSLQQSPFQNPQTPPLLSLRPNICPSNPKPAKQQPKKVSSKKK